jgi:cellulose synthase/poly-beta-1,6-N-acetylglucosamine synthase-like glycosyltransferase
MEVFVVSDCSSDLTDEIVRGFEARGIKLFRLRERSGKIAAYRNVLPYLKGEIVIFSDATSSLNADSITHLVSNFNDHTVGCVGGLLMYINPKQAIVGKGEKKYWSYEKKIRNYESTLSSLPSVSGTFYAVRKDLYPYNIKDDLADDLMVPFNVVKSGYRTVFEKDAVCKDFTTLSIKEETAKRIRITIQNIRGLIDQVGILNPFKYGLFSFLVISHKLFRLLVPLFLVLIFITSLILSFYSLFFFMIFVSQIIFYIGARLGYIINKRIKFSLGNVLFYFCLSNYAILKGFVKFFKGEKIVTWQTVRA